MPPIILIIFVLVVLGIGYYIRLVLRTHPALPTLTLLVLSLVVFVLFCVSSYSYNVAADETGTTGGVGIHEAVFGLLALGLGVASLAVHLRAQRSSG